ncbi:MAG: Hsp20 family protein [Pseudomonadota bacterium]
MRTIDLTPLYRTGVGFERLAHAMNTMLAAEGGSTYPPYNIDKTGEDAYRITLAVAGFSVDEIDIETKSGELVITGRREERAPEAGVETLYRGIAERSFERRFKLAEHVRVTGAELVDGLLHVTLLREVPEALKPRRIAIAGATGPARVAAE